MTENCFRVDDEVEVRSIYDFRSRIPKELRYLNENREIFAKGTIIAERQLHDGKYYWVVKHYPSNPHDYQNQAETEAVYGVDELTKVDFNPHRGDRVRVIRLNNWKLEVIKEAQHRVDNRKYNVTGMVLRLTPIAFYAYYEVQLDPQENGIVAFYSADELKKIK